MTRLEYWLKAKTQYNIHSPFVYDLYREVLFARVPRGAVIEKSEGVSRRFSTMLYKLIDHYHLRLTHHEAPVALLEGDGIGHVLLFDHPHASPESERSWTQLSTNEPYRVSIDIYDLGLLFTNPHLHPQHFLLR